MLILNENQYAERILQNGLEDCSPYAALSLLTRYYWHTLGYKKKQIKIALYAFLQRYYQRYEIDDYDWDECIEKMVMRAQKTSAPFVTSGIKITRSEIKTIEAINNDTLERLCFTILCVAKYNNKKRVNNNDWANIGDKELFQMARISCKSNERDIKIGRLKRMGLLEFPLKNDNLNFKVTFINDNDSEVLFITDMRELGYEYLLYKGGSFIRCQECGRLTKANKTGTKKYCEKCAVYSPVKTKKAVCADCGKEFIINAKNNRSCRCEECYTIYRRNYYKEFKQTQRVST